MGKRVDFCYTLYPTGQMGNLRFWINKNVLNELKATQNVFNMHITSLVVVFQDLD